MTVNEGLRLMAGTFVLLGLALGYFIHPGFYLFPVFVALNLIQKDKDVYRRLVLCGFGHRRSSCRSSR